MLEEQPQTTAFLSGRCQQKGLPSGEFQATKSFQVPFVLRLTAYILWVLRPQRPRRGTHRSSHTRLAKGWTKSPRSLATTWVDPARNAMGAKTHRLACQAIQSTATFSPRKSHKTKRPTETFDTYPRIIPSALLSSRPLIIGHGVRIKAVKRIKTKLSEDA